MLKNYLKIAFKVLARRKFFTAISLFGISLTLVVLMVATALLDHVFAPHPPETELDRILGIYTLRLEGEQSTSTGFPGYGFLDEVARDLPGAERMSIYSLQQRAVSYPDRRKILSWLKRTDGEFWKILDFEFVEGGPFTAEDEAHGNFVAVINETTRERFFGEGSSALGRTLELDDQRFRVVGVVEDVPFLRFSSFADVWVPISTKSSTAYRHELRGGFQALVLAESEAAKPLIREELQSRLADLQFPNPDEFHTAYSGAETLFEAFSRMLLADAARQARPGRLLGALLTMAVLFMLLPTVNLVNLNLSRILERTSEIGVRKAFGGSARELVGQFLVENVVLTLLGGAIGLVLSVLTLTAIEASGLIPYADLTLNPRIFLWGLALALVFALLSGVYPAWRMARMHPVRALRGRSA
jgi:putative ABC transport system permease protein